MKQRLILQVLVLILFSTQTLTFRYGIRNNQNKFRKFGGTSAKDAPPTEYITSYKGITPDTFAHPLDIAIRKQLQSIPFLEASARALFSTVEQALVVENLGSSILVGPNQMPALYRTLVKASKILDIDTPDLYVKQNPQPNAYTLAYRGANPFIVIHTGLLDILTENEVMAVLGHELGHLKCEHGIWVALLTVLAETFDSIIGPLVPLRSVLLQWQRAAEYSCDRASLLVAQDHQVVAAVLMKLCGGSSKNEFSKELNVEAFLEQVKQLEKEKESIGGRMYILTNDQFSTHPIPLIRAVELLNWSKSTQYSGIVRRAVKTKVNPTA